MDFRLSEFFMFSYNRLKNNGIWFDWNGKVYLVDDEAVTFKLSCNYNPFFHQWWIFCHYERSVEMVKVDQHDVNRIKNEWKFKKSTYKWNVTHFLVWQVFRRKSDMVMNSRICVENWRKDYKKTIQSKKWDEYDKK